MWKTITWLFETPMLLFFTFRTVEWALNILIFTEKHMCVCEWTFVWKSLLFSILLLFKHFVWKNVETKFGFVPFWGSRSLSEAVRTCYVC